ncbi:MAG: aldo/keto reductase [Kiritimatiellia bacterium]|jgi:aryl-alcohol dehydrogenase-like predicted oxidoreductase|nr:aldo/keto reductase [Kiritimatiellia bacterium]MDP6848248.1 aldo/keto reductase [Kiritimatiellia bacterium]
MIYGEIQGLPRSLPRIILGTLLLANTDEESFSLLDSAAGMGCYAIDTAHSYGDGASEKVVGNWMEARSNRSDVIIIDKGAHPADGKNRVNPESIRQDLQESLGRLKTDYIDLYLLHRDDPAMSVGPIIEVLNDLKNEGKIILFGASNWTHERLEEAGEYAETNGLATFSVASSQYSLATQFENPYPGTVSINNSADNHERDWYRKTQFPLLAWSSLARGFFSGRFTRDNLDTFTDPQSLISIRCYAREDNFARLDRARQLALEKGSTVPQIALAYILQQPINCFAVTGALTGGQLEENIEALETDLTEEEVGWLDLEHLD